MGIDSVGIEISPLSALMFNVKYQSLTLEPEDLKKVIALYFKELNDVLLNHYINLKGSKLLFSQKQDKNLVKERKEKIPNNFLSMLKKLGDNRRDSYSPRLG